MQRNCERTAVMYENALRVQIEAVPQPLGSIQAAPSLMSVPTPPAPSNSQHLGFSSEGLSQEGASGYGADPHLESMEEEEEEEGMHADQRQEAREQEQGGEDHRQQRMLHVDGIQQEDQPAEAENDELYWSISVGSDAGVSSAAMLMSTVPLAPRFLDVDLYPLSQSPLPSPLPLPQALPNQVFKFKTA
jgi:hypothetical protein